MENHSSSRLAEWLDGLARESWQLELVISGFAIFLLAGVYQPLMDLQVTIERLELSRQLQNFVGTPYGITLAAWFFMLVNLCIHVFFRGLWISAIGLRSVSNDIDYESLRLHPRFDRFLRRRIGSFDLYIERLEKICSVLFAFTFLILFMLLALGGMVILMSLVNLALHDWLQIESPSVVVIVNSLLVFGGFLYFLDFVTLSRLKRVRWLGRLYYPVYRFYSLVTFASLYRPLYYNLIDNRFGRRVGFLLVPYLILLAVATSIQYRAGAFFPGSSGPTALSADYYDDLRPEDTLWKEASISSRYVHNGFVELFLPYAPKDDDEAMKTLCPDLEKVNRIGLRLEGVINIQENRSGVSVDSVLLCMAGIHRVFVDDSLHVDPAFRFYTHPQREDDGLLAILDVAYLSRGEHLLRVETGMAVSDSLDWSQSARIPFWKE